MKKVIFACIGVLSILILSILFIPIDEPRPPKLPTKSVKNELIMTSNGCCLWIEAVNVYIKNSNGELFLIAHEDKVYQDNIFRHELPELSGGPFELVVEFKAFYSSNEEFSFSVMEFASAEAIKETGILLYFQEHDDMYFHVISKDYHVSYKMGNKENLWSILETPNPVYER